MSSPRFFGRARKKTEDGLNGTERAYRDHLEALKRAGTIRDYWVHPFSLCLAPSKGAQKGVYYRPDFLVQRMDDVLEIHETKGYRNDQGQAKLKIAADRFPFQFLLVRKGLVREGGGWKSETFG